jgi:hypothetical protein
MSARADHPKDYGYDAHGPDQRLMERLVSESLQVAVVPGDVLVMQTRPPAPALGLFPPRVGYDRRVLTIRDVMDIERSFPSGPGRTDFSGGPQGYVGGSRNASPTLGGHG